jgi:hypothetical protein
MRQCPIRRPRRTKAKIDEIKSAIVAVLEADNPMTVRQVFYQLVARGVIEKTEEQYQGTVIRLLTEMRIDDEVSFDWIVDESRRRRENQTYDSIADTARDTARFYRRNALQACPDYAEVWSEKEALAGIIEDAASDYDVPIIVSKGMPSLTQLYGTAHEIARAARAGKRTYIYQFGDHDPSGVLIPRTIESRLNELCPREKAIATPKISRATASNWTRCQRASCAQWCAKSSNATSASVISDSYVLPKIPSVNCSRRGPTESRTEMHTDKEIREWVKVQFGHLPKARQRKIRAYLKHVRDFYAEKPVKDVSPEALPSQPNLI